MIGWLLKIKNTSGLKLIFREGDEDVGSDTVVVFGRKQCIQEYYKISSFFLKNRDSFPGLNTALEALTENEQLTLLDTSGRRRLIICTYGGSMEIHSIVLSPEDCFPIGLAIARAFPMYSRKTSSLRCPNLVTVMFGYATRNIVGLTKTDYVAAAADGVRIAAYLVDVPCGKEAGVSLRCIRGEELKKEGLHLLYGVGKAAANPSNLTILSYTPEHAEKTICWVGKGIVYDCGGTALKSADSLRGMKRDLGGAAAVLGAFQAAVRSHFPWRIYAVFCVAENQISHLATRIDDIEVAYSGRTVEINNTDAEGRMVLADGICFACKNFLPDFVIDLATLTAVHTIATGRKIAAFYTASEELEMLAIKAGIACGELCHPLPFYPEFWREMLFSDVADMKNSVLRRDNCPSACAAHFIMEHIPSSYIQKWIHFDIAGPASDMDRGTGFGVGLLLKLLEAL
ncbi:Probable aminopeptidase NPEPL1 [Galdieria sulphuraria]|nr:Probable aminopeptidase NPEPL1 [Galdieria sulphuraria]